jgi:triacylglycerol esterase/lipase EstA (alpha/beta hydrolase family)
MSVIPKVSRRAVRIAQGIASEAKSLPSLLVRYPLGIFREGLQALEEPQQSEHDIPVIMLHGFIHNRSGFFVMRQHLQKQGFRRLYSFNYGVLTNRIEDIADKLAERVEEVLLLTRREKVHLVGHSLGGLVSRYYIQKMGGDMRVSKCVTMGTPHFGTQAAYLSYLPTALQMRPGSEFLRNLDALPIPPRIRWYSFYSRKDLLVFPYHNAILPEERFNAINFNMDDQGHLSFLLSPNVIDAVAEYLRDF